MITSPIHLLNEWNKFFFILFDEVLTKNTSFYAAGEPLVIQANGDIWKSHKEKIHIGL